MTWRSVAIALLLIPFQAWWITDMEVISMTTWPSMLALPLETLFILLVLLALNLPLIRRRSRWALTQGELLVIYIMLAIGGAVAGCGGLQAAIGWVITPAARATTENQWDMTFGQYLPEWLILRDKAAVSPLLEGETTLFTRDHLRLWAVPALSWGGFFLAYFVSMLSINTLLRRHWIEEERLTFPLVQVPLAVTGDEGAPFHSRLFWSAFGLTFAMGLLNGLHTFYPSLPLLQLDTGPVNQMLGQRFSALSWCVYPPPAWAIGVGFLMPVEIAFSYWFFYWFVKVQEVLTQLWGWDIAPDAPFVSGQSAGALLALAAFLIWSARRHLARSVREALRPDGAGDEGEPMRHRGALLMLALSLGFMAVLIWRAGAPLWTVPVYLAFLLLGTIAVARLRAELGAPANEVAGFSPQRLVVSPAAFPVQALTVLSVFSWTTRSFGVDPTPYQMEGFKMAERARLRASALPRAMVAATAVGLLAGYVAILSPLYSLGAESSEIRGDIMWESNKAFSQLQNAIIAPRGEGYHGIAMAAGALFTIALFAMRSRFLWWPFHPIGYLVAPGWFAQHLWFAIFIAWVVKAPLLRFGGRRAYHAALPFSYGLIAGDCVIGGIWALLGAILHTRTFSVWM